MKSTCVVLRIHVIQVVLIVWKFTVMLTDHTVDGMVMSSYQIGASVQVGFTGFQEVNQPAWSRNTDLTTCQRHKSYQVIVHPAR